MDDKSGVNGRLMDLYVQLAEEYRYQYSLLRNAIVISSAVLGVILGVAADFLIKMFTYTPRYDLEPPLVVGTVLSYLAGIGGVLLMYLYCEDMKGRLKAIQEKEIGTEIKLKLDEFGEIMLSQSHREPTFTPYIPLLVLACWLCGGFIVFWSIWEIRWGTVMLLFGILVSVLVMSQSNEILPLFENNSKDEWKHRMIKKVTDGLFDFRFLVLAIALFLLSNLVMFFVTSSYPELIKVLWLSADKPWGIFTAAFVHKDASHLAGNIVYFLISSIFFVLSNIPQEREGRSFYSKVFLLLVFFSGILWNAIEFFVWRRPSSITEFGGYGASGVVYGAIGICTASALVNFAAALRKYFRSLKASNREIAKPDLFSLLVNLMILILILALELVAPESFLAAGPETNIFAHFGGFAIGFIFASILFYKHSICRGENSGFAGG